VDLTYLADACALIVYLGDPSAPQIMTRSAAIMRSTAVRVSPITVWEITNKAAAGKLPAVWGHWESLSHVLRAQDFEFHALTWEDAEAANRLPNHHRDPMDRMLIATALRSDLTIITNDSIFSLYGVRTIW
jgi:PIN domain nuclease of toxin-antitoxin system